MKPLRTGLAVGALLASIPATLAAQASTVVERQTIPFEVEVENPCNGEVVQITGYLEVAVRVTVDANGVTHLAFNLVPHVEGEGETGKYKIVGGERSHETFIEGEEFPFSGNATFQFNIISQGEAPNFVLIAVTRLTYDADGTVRVDFEQVHESCTGG
jgi:hypothetical protein